MADFELFRGKHIYTLSMTENFDESLAVLERRGLVVGEVRALVVPFYSAGTQFHMTLTEVGLPARR